MQSIRSNSTAATSAATLGPPNIKRSSGCQREFSFVFCCSALPVPSSPNKRPRVLRSPAPTLSVAPATTKPLRDLVNELDQGRSSTGDRATSIQLRRFKRSDQSGNQSGRGRGPSFPPRPWCQPPNQNSDRPTDTDPSVQVRAHPDAVWLRTSWKLL